MKICKQLLLHVLFHSDLGFVYPKDPVLYIHEHSNRFYWDKISKLKLPYNFIREFQDKVDWYFISLNQTLSEEFIREFQNKVSWGTICITQNLSEDFIREFKDRVNWNYIRYFHILSNEFKREFQDRLAV